MMILRSAGPSPFGRKAKMAAKLTGQYDNITVENTDTISPDDSIRVQNPLGKIPTLILEDGTAFYDSRVICEYFDSLATEPRLFPEGPARWEALRLQALGDGLMDAGIMLIYEKRFRPEEKHHEPWLIYQQEKIDRALAVLEASPPNVSSTPTIGEVAIACALGYLDFRFESVWRSSYPQLVSWLDKFAEAVPAFAATEPKG